MALNIHQKLLVLLTCCFVSGCNSEPASSNSSLPAATVPVGPPSATVPVAPPAAGAGLSIPDNRTVNQFRVLLLGNSHVTYNNLAAMLKHILETGRPQAKVHTQYAGGAGFLDERLTDNITEPLLLTEVWSHVIVQGQKYSTSGLYNYPLDAAFYWLNLIKTQQATPILFPEHARYGNVEEGVRVYLLHQAIANEQAACVAPVPIAWYASYEQRPGLKLHLSDGNHANREGALLTAFIFYEVITGDPADQLPYIAELQVAGATQQFLRQLASATIQQHPACPF